MAAKKPKPDWRINTGPLMEWQPKDAAQKLDKLYQECLRLADDTIIWYDRYRARKGAWARGIRLTAIGLFIISTLIPYCAAFKGADGKSSDSNLLYFGYLIAGLGAGLLLLERFYGYTNSWIRFVMTGMDLKNLRNDFVCNWQVTYLNSMPLTKARFVQLMAALLKFREAFAGMVRIETETWAKEFQQSFVELSSAMKSNADSLKNTHRITGASTTLSPDNDDAETPQSAAPNKVSNAGPDIMEKAVRLHSAEWTTRYGGPFESIGVALRQKNGETQKDFCIQFDVAKKKDPDALELRVPELISFSYQGRDYLLPTDVVGVGDTVLTGYMPMDADNYVRGIHVNPRRPGVGCGRQGTKPGTGTIGMLVKRRGYPGKVYLLSCYHVLCAPELRQGIFRITQPPQNPYIVSPSLEDEDSLSPLNYIVGQVEAGVLQTGDHMHRGVDAAIAEVLDGKVIPYINNTTVAPTGGVYIDSGHVEDQYPVQMYGRSSGYQEGLIRASYTDQTVSYPSRANPLYKLYMRGVIKTTKICTGGDSGALVFDMQNQAIGLAFASNDQFTYIIPYQTIFKHLNLEFL